MNAPHPDPELDGPTRTGTRLLAGGATPQQADEDRGLLDFGPGPPLDPLGVLEGPRRLSHYTLLGKLGHGGMGVVYSAYDAKLDRKVAIKLLRSQSRKTARQRLVREAQAMARLSHPNVVQIYEIGEVEGRTFVVMEFVAGATLREWLSEHKRSRREILATFHAAGRGLAAAHGKGLVHRDFKPDNVMIASDGRVLVMDFGLARGLREAEPRTDSESSRELELELTVTGTLLGTPAYMAPEQLEGQRAEPSSDQFSFCVALWEALFGVRPFAGASLSGLSEQVAVGKPEIPERADVPSWLRKVVRRGLQADPEARWPSMNALLGALERDPTRRRRALLGLGVAVSAAALIQLAALGQRDLPSDEVAGQLSAELSRCERAGAEIEEVWNEATRTRLRRTFVATKLSFAQSAWERTERWMDGYLRDWTELRTEVCLAPRLGLINRSEHGEAILACLEDRKSTVASLTAAWSQADSETVTLALTAAASLPAIATCTSQLQLAPRIYPPAQLRGAVDSQRRELEAAAAQRLAGQFVAGLARAMAVRERARELGWPPLIAEAELAVGRLEDELGDYPAAEVALREAYLTALAGGHDRLALEAATWLTLVVGDKLGRYQQGLVWGEFGLRFIARLELDGSLDEAELLYGIGLIYDHLGDEEAARTALLRALELAETELGPMHPEVARQLNGLGGVYWDQGAYTQALDTQLRALDIVEEALGPSHPEVARALTNIGLVRGRLGEHRRALAVQRRALAIREAALGPGHPDVAATLAALGTTQRLAGQPAAAASSQRRALAIYEAELGPDHNNVARAQHRLALALSDQGLDDDALALELRALAVLERRLGTDHPDLAAPLAGIALIRARRGERRLATAALERVEALHATLLEHEQALLTEARARLERRGPAARAP